MMAMDETPKRLYALDVAIKAHPDAPVNYLLRGEYWVNEGKPELARPDLEKALTLATQAVEQSDWVYIYQSYADRAQDLLNWIEQS